MVGAHLKGHTGLFGTVLRLPSFRRDEALLANEARKALDRVAIPEAMFDRTAVDLAYGFQRRIEIARALAMDAQAILLDEPAAGLNSLETSEVGDLIVGLAKDGMTVLLVEHDMEMVMSISQHIVVMNFGRKIAEGTPSQVQSNQLVIEAYLGVEQDEQVRDDPPLAKVERSNVA